ncbi:MAG: energy transducer TonB [Bdellovibrio sp.]|nr:energy transducer TonB [Bdellovibrio sp.]
MRRNLALFIIISLILHLTSYTGLNLIPTSWYKDQKPDLTQVEIIEEKPAQRKAREKQKQMIKQLDPKDQISTNDPARFESEKTQRVKKETKASLSGLTSNQVSKVSQGQGENQQPSKPQQQQPREQGGDLPEFTRVVSGRSSQLEQARISIELPGDIQNANATNLNTDASTYYSFYNRVEELFYIRWVERVTSYWNRIPMDFKINNLYGRSWITQVTVLLDSNGVYSSSMVEHASGYPPFDEAVVYAFKNAHYFPNVPRAKVEPDGFVRLRYSFKVNIGPYR